MRAIALLAVLLAAAAVSDIARQYPAGKEPAAGGQDLARPAVNGKELAHAGNQDKSHIYVDLAR